MEDKYKVLNEYLKNNNMKIAIMEFYTSGLLTAALTPYVISGSYTPSISTMIDSGLGRLTVEDYGIYSSKAVIDMAKQCKKRSKSEIGIGVSGIFRCRYKDEVDEGESIFELENDGPINAIVYSLDTPKGNYNNIIEIPNYDTENISDKQMVIDIIVSKLEEILINELSSEKTSPKIEEKILLHRLNKDKEQYEKKHKRRTRFNAGKFITTTTMGVCGITAAIVCIKKMQSRK